MSRRRRAATGQIHGPWKRNPDASSIWDRLVLEGSYAGLYPEAYLHLDGSRRENVGVLTGMAPSTDWRWSDELNRYAVNVPRSTGRIIWPYRANMYDASLMGVAFWIKFASVDFSGGAGYLVAQWDYAANRRQWTIVASAANPGLWGFFTSGNGTSGSQSGANTTTAVATQWVHVTCNWTSRRYTSWWFNGVAAEQNLDSALGLTWTNLSSDAHTCLYDGFANRGPAADMADLLWRVGGHFSTEEITWLADRGNRLYVPQTRRVVRVPAAPAGVTFNATALTAAASIVGTPPSKTRTLQLSY
jgi:hypothetical protein